MIFEPCWLTGGLGYPADAPALAAVLAEPTDRLLQISEQIGGFLEAGRAADWLGDGDQETGVAGGGLAVPGRAVGAVAADDLGRALNAAHNTLSTVTGS